MRKRMMIHALTEPVRSVKLLVYNVNDSNETSIYVHKRIASRGGNVDINGVMSNAGDTLIDTVLACIEREFDNHPSVLDSAM